MAAIVDCGSQNTLRFYTPGSSSTLPLLSSLADAGTPGSGINLFSANYLGEPWLFYRDSNGQITRQQRAFPRIATVGFTGSGTWSGIGLPTFNEFVDSATNATPAAGSFLTQIARRNFVRNAGTGTLIGGFQETNSSGSFFRGASDGQGGFLMTALVAWTQRSANQSGAIGFTANLGTFPFNDIAASANGVFVGYTSVTGSATNAGLAATPVTDLEVITVNNGTAAANRTRVVLSNEFSTSDLYQVDIYAPSNASYVWVQVVRFASSGLVSVIHDAAITTTLPVSTTMMGLVGFAGNGPSGANAATFTCAGVQVGAGY